jgi:hypothetical protein
MSRGGKYPVPAPQDEGLSPFHPRRAVVRRVVQTGELTAEVGSMLFLEGTSSAHLYTVLSGWAFRYKMLPDGRNCGNASPHIDEPADAVE